MFRKVALVGMVVAALCAAAPKARASDGLFGTVDIALKDLDALPRWQRVVSAVENDEKPMFAACDADQSTCDIPALSSWRAFVQELKQEPNKMNQIREIQRFVNKWPYITDSDLWGKSDYWATPVEFVANSGDCEDYAILKFYTFKELGFKPEDVRIVVVQDVVRDLAHAVLSVRHNGENLILDSLVNAALPDSDMIQYKPYYSVNETTRWAHVKSLR